MLPICTAKLSTPNLVGYFVGFLKQLTLYTLGKEHKNYETNVFNSQFLVENFVVQIIAQLLGMRGLNSSI